MSNYWLRDPSHGVVGPISLLVAKDLVVGHVFPRTSDVSTDGQTWKSLESVAELRVVFDADALPERHAKEIQEAQRIQLQLDRFQELSVHELFGVPRGSKIEVYRQAYRTLAANYFPGRLPAEAHRDLREAHSEVFEFLSREIAKLEAQAPPKPPAHTPVPAAIPPRLSELVTIGQNTSGRMVIRMRVTPERMGIFTDHRLVNLSTGGVFLYTREPLRLGTQFELILNFGPPPKELKAQGVVILENALSDPKQTPGFGVRLERLSHDAKAYLTKVVAEAVAARQAKGPGHSPR